MTLSDGLIIPTSEARTGAIKMTKPNDVTEAIAYLLYKVKKMKQYMICFLMFQMVSLVHRNLVIFRIKPWILTKKPSPRIKKW